MHKFCACFSNKEDIIDRVKAFKVNVNRRAGINVRLECIVKRQLWMNFFNDPEENYGDLGVKRVLHDCEDLVNCDRVLLA